MKLYLNHFILVCYDSLNKKKYNISINHLAAACPSFEGIIDVFSPMDLVVWNGKRSTAPKYSVTKEGLAHELFF